MGDSEYHPAQSEPFEFTVEEVQVEEPEPEPEEEAGGGIPGFQVGFIAIGLIAFSFLYYNRKH